MKLLFLLMISVAPSLAGADEAEVFKCKSAKHEVIYQSEPCSPHERQQVIQVDAHSPEEREKAEAELREWREQEARQDAEDAIRMQEEEQRQSRLERQQAELEQSRQMQRQAIETQKSWNPFHQPVYAPNPGQRLK